MRTSGARISLHVPPVAARGSPGNVCFPPAVQRLADQENCILKVSLSVRVRVSTVKGQKTAVQCKACLSPSVCLIEFIQFLRTEEEAV